MGVAIAPGLRVIKGMRGEAKSSSPDSGAVRLHPPIGTAPSATRRRFESHALRSTDDPIVFGVAYDLPCGGVRNRRRWKSATWIADRLGWDPARPLVQLTKIPAIAQMLVVER